MLCAPRPAVLLAGIWAGALLVIAGMAAPTAFAVTTPDVAGRFVGRLFAQEAYTGLALAGVLVWLLRQHARRLADSGAMPLFSVNLMLVLGAVFCTVAGYFAIEPMMVGARAGQGRLSFGALHALSAGFFGLKGLLVLALAWRLAGR